MDINIGDKIKINNPYNPNTYSVEGILVQKTFEYLFLSQTDEYLIIIEEGFYNPQQMVIELTNKFNHAVTIRLEQYFLTQF